MTDFEPRPRPKPKPLDYNESSFDKEQEKSLKYLVGRVEETIVEYYDIDNEEISSAVNFLWFESDEALKSLTEREELNPEGEVITYRGSGGYGSILYLNPELRRRLANLNETEMFSGNIQQFRDYLTLVEEVSHFVYINYHMKKFGEKPESALVELLATVDRFTVIRDEYRGETLSAWLTAELHKYNEGLFNPDFVEKIPAAYIIGHRLGVEYWERLKELPERGRREELMFFYRQRHPDQIKHLLYDVGLDFHSFGDYERKGLVELFEKLDMEIEEVESGDYMLK